MSVFGQLLCAVFVPLVLCAVLCKCDSSSPLPTPSSYPPSAVTQQQLDEWLGQFTNLPGCTASAACCCGTGPVNIVVGPANGTISVSGNTDGGAGCFGFSTLSAIFIVSTPTYAYYNLAQLNTVVQLNMTDNLNIITMTIGNLIYTCQTKPQFERSAQTTAPPSTPSTTPQTTAPSTPSTPTQSTTTTSAELALAANADYATQVLNVVSDSTSTLLVFTFSLLDFQSSVAASAINVSALTLDYVILHYSVCALCSVINVNMAEYSSSVYGHTYLGTYLSNALPTNAIENLVYGPIELDRGRAISVLYSFTYSLFSVAVESTNFIYQVDSGVNDKITTATPTTTLPVVSTTITPTLLSSTLHSSGTTPAPNIIDPTPILGVWYSDSSACQPSESCCCVIGQATVAKPQNASQIDVVDVTFTLSGVGYSCYQLDSGALTWPFTLQNLTYGSYSPPQYPFVVFAAMPNSDYSRITITNNVEPTCLSAVYRQQNTANYVLPIVPTTTGMATATICWILSMLAMHNAECSLHATDYTAL